MLTFDQLVPVNNFTKLIRDGAFQKSSRKFAYEVYIIMIHSIMSLNNFPIVCAYLLMFIYIKSHINVSIKNIT